MILILQDIGHWYRLLQHRFQLHLSVCVCLFRLHIFSTRCIFTTPKIVFEYQVQWFMFKGHTNKDIIFHVQRPSEAPGQGYWTSRSHRG